MKFVYIGGELRLINRIVVDHVSNEVDIPSGTASGDLLVTLLATYSAAGIPTTTLTGFTLITSANTTIFTDRYLLGAWYRVCDGSEGASIPYANNILSGITYCIRAPRAITGVQATPSADWSAEVTAGNPSPQTILASGGLSPLIACAFAGDEGASGFSVESPAFDVQDVGIGQSSLGVAGLTIYNGTSLDHTVDMSDGGYWNGLISGFIEPQF